MPDWITKMYDRCLVKLFPVEKKIIALYYRLSMLNMHASGMHVYPCNMHPRGN